MGRKNNKPLIKPRNKMDPNRKKKISNGIMVVIIILSIFAFVQMSLVYFEREELINQIEENKDLEMAYFKFNPDKIIGSNLIDNAIQINFGNGTSVRVCYAGDIDSFYQNDTHYQCNDNSPFIKAGKQ